MNLHKAIVSAAAGDQFERYFCAYRAEERQAIAQYNGYLRQNNFVDKTGLKKVLDRRAAVDIEAVFVAGCQLSDDLGGGAAKRLYFSLQGFGNGYGAAGQHGDKSALIGPFGKTQDLLKAVAAHDQRVDAFDKSAIAPIVSVLGGVFRLVQPVDIAVGAGDKTVEATGDKYRALCWQIALS